MTSTIVGVQMSDSEKVRCGKLSAVALGVIAMALGILFKQFNVSFLVGWAFNIAASANLPALVAPSTREIAPYKNSRAGRHHHARL